MYSSYSPYSSYTTVYEYEAKSMVGDIGLKLGKDYLEMAMILMVLTAILALGLALFTAIANKKARPLGIVVAILQPIGVFAAYKSVITYADVDFSALEMTVKSTKSMEDAMSKLYEKLGETFFDKILPEMMSYMFWAMVLAAVTIVTLVYIILLMKGQSKGLAIGALILLIVRHFLIAPVDLMGVLFQWDTQGAWDMLFRLFYLLPLILIAIQGLMVMIAKKNGADVVVEASAEAQEESVVETVANEEIPMGTLQSLGNMKQKDPSDNE